MQISFYVFDIMKLVRYSGLVNNIFTLKKNIIPTSITISVHQMGNVIKYIYYNVN